MTPTDLTQSEVKTETEVSVKKTDKKTDRNIARFARMRDSQKVNSGMFNTPEIVAVAAAGLGLICVIFAYFLMLLPAREEFRKSEAERSLKQAQLSDLQAKAKLAGVNAAGTVDLMSSVDRFESNFLPLAVNGNAALYQRLNELIRSNNLRNTAGPQYSPLEMIDPSKAAKIEERRGNGKQPGIFPGTYVTVTVEGSYGSLRHFISDLESTRQYLVINAIEIQPNANGENNSPTVINSDASGATEFPNNSKGASAAGMPKGFPSSPMQSSKVNPRLSNNSPATMSAPSSPPAAATQLKRGAVSLQIEMAAYFRRPTPATPAQN